MKISVNLQAIFGNANIEESFIRMKKSGFHDFERWFVDPAEVDDLRLCTERHGMNMTTFCTRYFDLATSANRELYIEGLKGALKDARKLSCRGLITQVGNDSGIGREEQHESIVSGLKQCVPLLEESGVTLFMEPLNTVKDHPGYYLSSSDEAFDIAREVGSRNVKVLFDVYHQLHMGEDVLKQIADHIDLIGHFHIAGFPDRDEKLFERFNHIPLFELLKRIGYDGHIGLELFIKNGTSEDFFCMLRNAVPDL